MEPQQNIETLNLDLQCYESLQGNSEIDFDLYDLHNTKSRIQSLETLLCYLVKQNKPIDNCLIALNYLKSNNEGKIEKPKQTMPQMIADSFYNGFAVLGMLLFLVSITRVNCTKSYSPNEVPSIQQGQFNRAD
ncbi:MAG: hypothetical protein HC815_05765 [Richelia sp. RM1_1_1]|nr:hypothetical protein [Richelia sp. RM1_1_1]